MAHKITPFTKVEKSKDEPKFEVTNRKERRRLKSKINSQVKAGPKAFR